MKQIKQITSSVPKDFQLELLKTFIKKEININNNIVISPISLLFPLALLAKGAQGQTLLELQKVLSDISNKNKYIDNIKQIYDTIKNEKCLKIAGALLSKIKMSDMITQRANLLDVKIDDIKNSNQINNWVKEKTGNKIKNIVDQVDPSTVLILLNAIYFQDEWEEKFNSTKTSNFYLSNNTTKKINLMYHKFKSANYIENDDFQAINLRYKHSEITATIILPYKNISINDFILNSKFLSNYFKGSQPSIGGPEVELYLPKIKLENSYDLKTILHEMGLNQALEEKADFSLLSKTKPLFISAIKQKTFLEIDEKGTTAAAATFIGMTLGLKKNLPIIMRCDRPFLIYFCKYCPAIKENLVLFWAKIENP